jgi:hypothetical protein
MANKYGDCPKTKVTFVIAFVVDIFSLLLLIQDMSRYVHSAYS